jgi:hypothetical protein
MLTAVSCNSPAKHPEATVPADTADHGPVTKQVDKSAYYLTQDSLVIPTKLGDTLVYTKEEFNAMVDKHPELYSDYVMNPDLVYNENRPGFNSEVGQDYYYVLYAYFLKQKNGVEKYAERRDKLLDIYYRINELFGDFEHGGTYFGHQAMRIEGYAEYSIYLYKYSEDNLYKTYDITRQKALYIQSLHQLVEDEDSIDTGTAEQHKVKHNKYLHKLVDDIGKAITDNFYLRRAQEFHYGHYEYY